MRRVLLAGPARGLARRPLLGPSLPALPAGCRCHRRPLSTGEPYMTDVREITPGMESDLGDGVPLPSEPEQEAPRTSRERLAAFLEMREVFAAETADEIAEMKKEIRFLAAGYQLAANAAAAAPDEAAAMVREECERRGVLINDELKATEELAELCFGEGWLDEMQQR